MDLEMRVDTSLMARLLPITTIGSIKDSMHLLGL